MTELEMVVTAIAQLGDNGTTAFIWWLAKDLLVNICWASLWTIFFVSCFKLLKTIIDHEVKK